MSKGPPIFTAMPSATRKKATRKASTHLVHPEGRSFTRSFLKRPQPVSNSPLKPKKRKIRAMLLIVLADKEKATWHMSDSDTSSAEKEFDQDNVPTTPIKVMQNVGMELGISLQKLTGEQLEADLKNDKVQKNKDVE
jgi:hypothetical protein